MFVIGQKKNSKKIVVGIVFAPLIRIHMDFQFTGASDFVRPKISAYLAARNLSSRIFENICLERNR